MEFTCPNCNVSLSAQKLADVRLWICASCKGLSISLPVVRRELNTQTFRKIWQRLSSGESVNGRPCPGCKNPLRVVQADGPDGAIMIDVCRTCQILWFDHTEFVDLPKVERKKPAKKGAVTTREERAFAAFKADQFRRRSFFMKLLDGTVAKELGLENFFSEDFDK